MSQELLNRIAALEARIAALEHREHMRMWPVPNTPFMPYPTHPYPGPAGPTWNPPTPIWAGVSPFPPGTVVAQSSETKPL